VISYETDFYISDPVEFRTWLRSEFDRRRKANPRYSVRAFAKALKIDHSTLSQLLRGKRTLTGKMMARLRARLDWTEDMRRLLSAICMQGFRPDIRRCAETLGISPDAAAIALQRLLRLGQLKMEGEQWVPL
jgi:transcriptional regulator with XRE-family HTH domain